MIIVVMSFAGCVPMAPPAATPVFVSSPTVVANVDTVVEVRSEPAMRPVMVFADKRIGRATEVIGVLDFHSDAQSQDKGFDELRARGAAMGADAIISAEFEHGEGGERSHLSGLAVRFLAE